MPHQKDITPHMRAILVDWLIEVAEEYKLSSETLYLAVSYIDRYPYISDFCGFIFHFPSCIFHFDGHPLIFLKRQL